MESLEKKIFGQFCLAHISEFQVEVCLPEWSGRYSPTDAIYELDELIEWLKIVRDLVNDANPKKVKNGDFANIALAEFINEVKDQPYLILDTETTGLERGEIVQIAIINNRGEILLNTYVKPVNGIPSDAQRIHGISLDMVKDAPTWGEVAPTVLKIIQDQKLIVYNAIYDRKMMHQSLEALGLPKVDWKQHAQWLCAMTAFAEHYGDYNSYRGSYRWQKLVNAVQFVGSPVVNAHSALGDCYMTLSVAQAMIKGVNNG